MCSKCQDELPLSAFNRNGDDWQYYCRDCFRQYFQARGRRHQDQVNAGRRTRADAGRQHLLEVLRTRACEDCGEADPVVLEFDHLRDRIECLSAMAGDGASIALLDAEIAKCEVVCANCHRMRTAKRAGWRRAVVPWWNTAPPKSLRVRENTAVAYSILDRCGCTALPALDFDHVGVKTDSVMRLVHEGATLPRVMEEIDQCVVRCANCHRRRTATTGGYYRAAAARILEEPL